MRKEYNKLVRDRIPEIIAADGRICETRTLTEPEYRTALLAKLIEEVQEAAQSSPDTLPTEIADIYEVLDALLALHGLDLAGIRSLQTQRRTERGGFARRLLLLWTA